MLRRLLFGLSFALLVAAAVGGIAAAWSDEGTVGWVLAVALGGVALFVAGVAIMMRDLLSGVRKIVRDHARQRARLAAMEGAVTSLNKESAVRDDLLLSRLAKVEAETETGIANNRSLHQALKKQVRESDRRIRELTKLLDVVKARQKEQGRALSNLESGVSQLGSRQTNTLRPTLERIESSQAEKITPALRRIEREQTQGYRQLEAVSGLLSSLGLRSPLPPLRNTWAIDPDSAGLLIRRVLAESPGTVVELGSGLSTVMVAKALEILASGRLISVDHKHYYLEETRALLEAESLDTEVELVEAPLVEVVLDGVEWQWYSPSVFEGLDTVDLVIVDGPPSSTGPEARYPAVPVLAPHMKKGSLVFLDDANREDEQRIIDRWLSEYPLEALSVPKTEKGAALLQWNT